jgi:hypothetical protein
MSGTSLSISLGPACFDSNLKPQRQISVCVQDSAANSPSTDGIASRVASDGPIPADYSIQGG